MMLLRKIGFFVELDHGDEAGSSLRDSVKRQGERDENELIKYLEEGVLLIACPGVGFDVLDEAAGPIDPPHILTDGVWAWPGDLMHYLKEYHVALPESFLSHVRERRYVMPPAESLVLTDLEI